MAATSSIQGVASSAPEARAGGRRSTAFGGAPALDQRPRIAMDRVACGQRNRGDPRQGAGAIRATRTAHIGALAARIGADDQEVRACALVLVGDAGRDWKSSSGTMMGITCSVAGLYAWSAPTEETRALTSSAGCAVKFASRARYVSQALREAICASRGSSHSVPTNSAIAGLSIGSNPSVTTLTLKKGYPVPMSSRQ
jgi:hypothetical protein